MDELAQLRAGLSAREEQLSRQIIRQAETETLLLARDKTIASLVRGADQMRLDAQLAHAEVEALELALAQTLERGTEADALPRLQGQCVLYVGGRPQTTQLLAKLVAAAGGELLVHDGGIEDRKGMLASMLPRAQLVVFPVDCISHNAMHVTRQLAERNGIPCHPLRTSGIASFVELIHRIKHLEIRTS